MRRFVCVLLFVCLLGTSAGAADSQPGEIAQVRDVDTWIDLSGDTRPVAVLCPDRPVYLEAARAVADAIEKAGAARPTVSCDPQAATPETHNVVALGNVNNNRLIARLYFNFYAFEDSLLPGGSGYSLRTVYDPYPWHGKGHVVVLGTSDDEGAAHAAAELAERIRAGRTRAGVDYTLEISTAPPLTEGQIKALEADRPFISPTRHLENPS